MGKTHDSCTQTTIDIRECKEQRYDSWYVIVIWQHKFVTLDGRILPALNRKGLINSASNNTNVSF
jgi:hypothetical protein